jgi:hypothetical protein
LQVIAPVCAEVHAVDVNRESETSMPQGARFWNMTSDQFFRRFDGSPPNVVFIDADHRYDQAKRDFDAALELLAPGGTVFLHDTWPRDEEDTTPLRCGTVWKLAEELAQSPRFESFTWPGTPGLTIVRRRGEARDRSQIRSG